VKPIFKKNYKETERTACLRRNRKMNHLTPTGTVVGGSDEFKKPVILLRIAFLLMGEGGSSVTRSEGKGKPCKNRSCSGEKKTN